MWNILLFFKCGFFLLLFCITYFVAVWKINFVRKLVSVFYMQEHLHNRAHPSLRSSPTPHLPLVVHHTCRILSHNQVFTTSFPIKVIVNIHVHKLSVENIVTSRTHRVASISKYGFFHSSCHHSCRAAVHGKRPVPHVDPRRFTGEDVKCGKLHWRDFVCTEITNLWKVEWITITNNDYILAISGVKSNDVTLQCPYRSTFLTTQ